jgi:uncharacterized OB-fold protein
MLGARLGDGAAVSESDLVMEQKVTLHYREALPPNLARFGDALLGGRFLGAKCPACDRVYVPNRGYCPLCAVLMTEADERDVSDRGVVASYTVIAPVRYYGQTKTEPFVFATVLLDGTSTVLRGQDITGIPIDQVHAGLRVAAGWRPGPDRTLDGLSARGGASLEGCISSFSPTGEPDLPEDAYRGFEF